MNTRLRILLFILLVLTLAVAPAGAAPTAEGWPIAVPVAQIGIDGFAGRSYLTPVKIVAQADSEAAHGELQVVVSKPGLLDIYSRRLDLERGAQKAMWYFVDIAFGDEVFVRLNVDGGQFELGPLDYRVPEKTALRILAINGSTGHFNFLSNRLAWPVEDPSFISWVEPGSNPVQRQPVQGYSLQYYEDKKFSCATIQSSDTPPEVEGLVDFDLIMVREVWAESLTESQREALRDYVCSGGGLMILGGLGDWLQDPFWLELLPEQPVGRDEYLDMELPCALFELPLEDKRLDLPTQRLDLAGLPGAKLIVSGEQTLLSRRGLGLGRVYLLHFDPLTRAFLRWGGAVDFLDYACRTAAAEGSPSLLRRSDPDGGGSFTGTPAYYGGNMPQATGEGKLQPLLDEAQWVNLENETGRSAVILFMMLYMAVVGPLNYLLLKKARLAQLMWITTPLIVAAFTAMTWFWGVSKYGFSLGARQATLVEFAGDGSGEGVLSSAFSLFSPSDKGYRLQDDEGGRIWHFDASKNVLQQAEINKRRREFGEGSHPSLDKLHVNVWSSERFYSQRIERQSGNILLRCRADGRDLALTALNRTGRQLKGLCLGVTRADGSVLYKTLQGTLPAGEERSWDVSPDVMRVLEQPVSDPSRMSTYQPYNREPAEPRTPTDTMQRLLLEMAGENPSPRLIMIGESSDNEAGPAEYDFLNQARYSLHKTLFSASMPVRDLRFNDFDADDYAGSFGRLTPVMFRAKGASTGHPDSNAGSRRGQLLYEFPSFKVLLEAELPVTGSRGLRSEFIGRELNLTLNHDRAEDLEVTIFDYELARWRNLRVSSSGGQTGTLVARGVIEQSYIGPRGITLKIETQGSRSVFIEHISLSFKPQVGGSQLAR